MPWTIVDTGSWVEATTSNPAVDMPAAMALPQSYRWHVHGLTALVRRDQIAALASGSTGPPVAGYVAWYDASQITGQADNTPLASWPDLSGNGHGLSQATPANRPTFYSSTAGKLINGKPAVWFADTGPNWMAAAAFSSPLAQPGVVFAVAQHSVAVPANATVVDGNAGRWSVSVGTSVAAFYEYTGGIVQRANGVDSLLHCYSAVFNGGTSSFALDGEAPTSGNAGAQTLDQVFVGIPGVAETTAYGWTGPICEVVYYNSALTGPQIASVQAYLKSKWGTP